jgi:hypothetical protein
MNRSTLLSNPSITKKGKHQQQPRLAWLFWMSKVIPSRRSQANLD